MAGLAWAWAALVCPRGGSSVPGPADGSCAATEEAPGCGCGAAPGSTFGGWECFDPEALPSSVATRRGASEFCDFPSFDAQNVPAELLGDRGWAHKPFILRGDRGVLGQQARFEMQSLLRAAKLHQLGADLGYSWDIVLNSGSGPSRVKLEDFLLRLMRLDWYDGDAPLERPYMFGRHEPLARALDASIPVHTFIRSWSNKSFARDDAQVAIVLIGGAGSGVGFHRHAAAIQATLYGRKRWLLYPPDGNPPGGMKGDWPVYDWHTIVYPNLSADQAPLECVQGPGDVFYVPEGWYHAVLNLADSVALSAQHDGFSNKSMKATNKFREAKDPKHRLRYARMASKLLPTSIESKIDLFDALVDAEKVEEAFGIITEVVQADPLFVHAQKAIFQLMKKFGAKDLLPALREFKPHLERNPRNLFANMLLSYFHLLNNDRKMALDYLRRNEGLQALGVNRSDAPSFRDMAESMADRLQSK